MDSIESSFGSVPRRVQLRGITHCSLRWPARGLFRRPGAHHCQRSRTGQRSRVGVRRHPASHRRVGRCIKVQFYQTETGAAPS